MDNCKIERYNSNNGIVLRSKAGDVLFYIQGEDIGILPTTSDDIAFSKAAVMFKVLLKTRRMFYTEGYNCGWRDKHDQIKNAINA